MNFTKEFIEELKDSIDIVSHISRYTNLKRSGNVYIGNCPHPNHQDSTPSFRVWGDSQSWACMGCHYGSKGAHNYGSDIIAFTQWMDNLDFPSAVISLAEQYGITIPESKTVSPKYEKNKKICIDAHMKVVVIEEYLASRGIDRDTILKFKIGFNGDRIVIPLFDKFNRVVGFSNRAYMSDGGPKYINSRNDDVFIKNEYIYNLNNIDYNKDYIILSEGAMDTIVANRYNVDNVVSTLGTAVTDNHVDILKDLKKTPIICFDGDRAGREATKKLVSKFNKKNIYHKVFQMPDDTDLADLANSLKENTLDYILKNSISYNQFLVNNILLRYQSQVNEIKVNFYPELKKIVDSIEHDIERKIISDKIENELQIKL